MLKFLFLKCPAISEVCRYIEDTMNGLTIFGLFAVSAMLVCYAFDGRSHWWTLGFAVACLLGSVYGFLQGAWPFGLIEGIWSLIAFRRWAQRRGSN